MKITSYRELIVWQKSMDLATLIFNITKSFPASEQYGLTNQIRRACFSIPSNIAEGFCRGGRPEFRQFLQIAFASGAELETELEIAKNIGILQDKDYKILISKLDEIMRMLNKMIRTVRDNQKQSSR
ncbi:MAG: four helix bundle protein [Patescibacteria group bacterium]